MDRSKEVDDGLGVHSCRLPMISNARTKLESQVVDRSGHKRRGHNHCDIDTPSMTMVY